MYPGYSFNVFVWKLLLPLEIMCMGAYPVVVGAYSGYYGLRDLTNYMIVTGLCGIEDESKTWGKSFIVLVYRYSIHSFWSVNLSPDMVIGMLNIT